LASLINGVTGETLSAELKLPYNHFEAPGSVTQSDGFVAASKTMHFLFPQPAP